MSSITVAGITPDLSVLGAYQNFVYTNNVSSFRLTNNFVPTIVIPSVTNFEWRNNALSGFRLYHTTLSTDTYGTLTLQNFVSASPTGNDMITFGSNGITIDVPVNLGASIITGGTWNGNTITVPYGGTGVTSATAYSVLCGGTTPTGALQSVANVGTIGQVLTSSGAGALPIWSAAGSGSVQSITAGTGLTGGTITVTGTINIANTAVAAGAYTYGGFTVNAQGQLTAASNGATPLLVSNNLSDLANAATARTNLGLTNIATQTVTQNSVLIGGATDSIASIPLTNGQILIGSTGVAPVASTPINGVNISWVSGAGSLTANLTGQVAVANGGTGLSTVTPYSIVCGGTTGPGALQTVATLGTEGQVLTSSGAGALPSWESRAYGYMKVISNVTTTTITTASIFYKLLVGAFTSSSSLFTVTANRMQYTGTTPVNVYINVTLDGSLSGGGTTLTYAIYKNDVSISAPITGNTNNSPLSVSVCCVIPLVTNDYVEVWVTCGANGRVLTVIDMNFTVFSL